MKILSEKNICRESVNQFMEYFYYYGLLLKICDVTLCSMSKRIWKASRKGQTRRNYKATNNSMAFQFWSLSDWAFCSLRIPLGFVSVQATGKNLSDLLLSTFKRFELARSSKPRFYPAPLFFKFWKLHRTKFVR